MRYTWIVAAVLAVALILAGCAASSGADAGDASAAETSAVGDAEAGRSVYETGGSSLIPCASCHTLDGTALIGPSLQGIAGVAGTRVPGQSAVEYLRASIVRPSAYVVEGYDDLMTKTYGDTLSEQEINDLIAFMLTQ
jgi:cytochrome c2